MRALVLVAVAACTTAPAAKSPAVAPSGPQLLDRVLQTYATARAYRDHGQVRLRVSGREMTRTFHTAFARGRGLRFELEDAAVVWLDGSASHVAADGHVQDYGKLDEALAAAADSTFNVSVLVPAFLLGDKSVATALGVPAAKPNGAGWSIVFTDKQRTITFDVDAKLVLTHVEQRLRGGDVDVDESVDYVGELGVDVAAAELRGPDIAAIEANAPTWIGVMFGAGGTDVRDVVTGSPAAKAGVQAGDHVVSIAGVAVKDAGDVIAQVQKHRGGEQVAVVIERGGARTTKQIVIEVRPDLVKLQATKLVDKPAPDIALTTLDGTPFKLSDHKGKVVVLDFWASWCGPCRSAFPTLARWHQQLASKGVMVVGVTNDELAAVKDTVREYALPYPTAIDDAGAAWHDYLVQALPTTVVIDKAGIVRMVMLGAGSEADIEAMITKLIP